MTVLNRQTNVKLNTLDRFYEINRTFPQTEHILQHKREGKKVFGWLCTYVPEEIIHAAGILPVRITGYSNEVELDDGNERIRFPRRRGWRFHV
jgi:benzoyl-CoA reductase/2-hydroxyglutaryl-CoA dehydratase subunit BcrC/BadD/HgdB